jgi:hypothetical protein
MWREAPDSCGIIDIPPGTGYIDSSAGRGRGVTLAVRSASTRA